MEKANYRDGLDALNALVDEQRKTNSLLEKLFEQREETQNASSIERETTIPRKRSYRRDGDNTE